MRWEEDMTTSIWFMRSLVGSGEGQWSWLMGFSAILSAELIIEYQKVIKKLTQKNPANKDETE